MKRAILLFMLCCVENQTAWPLNPATALAHYNRQAWSTENGLPQNSVHAILQTRDGYLWLATEAGLARFDGYQFRVFDRDTSPSLAGNDILCLLEDRSGALWIGTTSGLTRMQDGTARTFTTADGLPSNTIRTLLQSADGTLWALTAGGLANLPASGNRLKFDALSMRSGLLDDHVNAIAPAPAGGLWAATSRGLNLIHTTAAGNDIQPGPPGTVGMSIDTVALGDAGTLLFASPEGIMQLAGTSLLLLAKPESLPTGGVRTLLTTPDGIWVTDKNSATLIHPHTNQTFATGRALPGSQIQTILLDRQGTVWIGTNDGLVRWWHGKMEVVSEAGSHSSAILSLYEDREGDLWVGTETGGVAELKDRTFEMVGRTQGLADEAATSVVGARDGSLWIGTGSGGLTRIQPSGEHQTLTVKDGLASDTILALAPGPEDSTQYTGSEVWIGTPDGLTHMQDRRMQIYGPSDGLADDFVRSLLSARDGALWVGTRHGVTRWKQGKSVTWTTAQGLGSDLVGAMLEDSVGDPWIGTLGGLTHIHNGVLTNYTVADGLPSNIVTALETGPDGSLWVGTRGQGLAFRDALIKDATRFFSFAAASSLPRTIYAILDDRLGALWLSSDRGLDRVTLTELQLFRSNPAHSIVVTHYGTADGLASLEGADAGHPSAWRMADGRLCFATRRGVAILDPVHLPGAGLPPPIVIEQITVDDRGVTGQELTSLAPGPSHFSFTFAAINLSSPQRVQYRYMLEGFDRNWVEAGARRTAYYTNIPHGRYRFIVTARDSGGAWNASPASVSMQLRPHFYQTVWFWLLLLILFGAAVFGLFRLRVQALKSRFDAVTAERSRLAREIHDTLAQGFVAVSVRLEILSQILRSDPVQQSSDLKSLDSKSRDLRIHQSRAQLDETRALVRDGLSEARRSIWNLRSEGTDAQTLPSRLARSVQEATARGLRAQLDTIGVYRPLHLAIEDELYRIAQESIANSLRHAAATTLQVRLEYAHDLLLLKVTDDGHGFDVASAPSRGQGHFGLTGIEERAREIGATVMLESAPDHGTTVSVELPLTRSGKALTRSGKKDLRKRK